MSIEKNDTKIDSKKLRADTNALARECRALKDQLGTTWTRPMADEQRKLARLRVRATELCVLRAWTRHRVHVQNAPPGIDAERWDRAAWHSKIAERVAKDYEAKPDVSADGADDDASARGAA